jgi:hypothetical protein
MYLKNYIKTIILINYFILSTSFLTNKLFVNKLLKNNIHNVHNIHNIHKLHNIHNIHKLHNKKNLLLCKCSLFLNNDKDDDDNYSNNDNYSDDDSYRKSPILRMNYNITNNKKYIRDNLNIKEDDEYKKKSSKEIIVKINFDTLFLKIFNINKIYMSSNYDRIIICYDDNNKNVFYIETDEDKQKINYLIKLINKNIKIIIISDYHNIMDSPFGYLYCETK